MKTLILMRHAKSDWTGSSPDHERPLTPRGVRSARALGDWLRAQRLVPDEAIVSTARRTRETYGLLALDNSVRFEPSLYDANPETVADQLKLSEGGLVLLVGHNPSIALLAHQLAACAPDHERWDDMPTGSTVVARFDVVHWADLVLGEARLDAFVTPQDLLDG